MAEDDLEASRGGKYLTFRLASEEYGLEILRVQEIIGVMPITGIPRTPAAVRGVINLRGRVIPVIDLRIKFGAASPQDTERTCIIVVQIETGAGAAVMGVVVDEVSEVVDIPRGQVEDTPDFGPGVSAEYVLGIGKVADKVVLLLDIDRVLSGREVAAAGRIAREADRL